MNPELALSTKGAQVRDIKDLAGPVRILVAGVGLVSGLASIALLQGLARWAAVSAVTILAAYLVVAYFRMARRLDQLAGASLAFAAPYRVDSATRGDIAWIAETAKKVYTGVDVIPYRTLLEWFDRNPTGFFVVKDRHGHLCGNIDVLPLDRRILELFIDGKILEREFRAEHILPPSQRDAIECLHVESFVAPGNPWAVRECLMSMGRIVRHICNPQNVEGVYAIAASDSGVGVAERLGFSPVRSGSGRRDGHTVYRASLPDLCRNVTEFARPECRSDLLAILDEPGHIQTL